VAAKGQQLEKILRDKDLLRKVLEENTLKEEEPTKDEDAAEDDNNDNE